MQNPGYHTKQDCHGLSWQLSEMPSQITTPKPYIGVIPNHDQTIYNRIYLFYTGEIRYFLGLDFEKIFHHTHALSARSIVWAMTAPTMNNKDN